MIRALLISFLLILIVPCVHAKFHINEIYPYPSSNGDGFEYVELYNDGDSLVTSDYMLEDAAGNKLSFLDSIIATSSYSLAQSKNVLNNSGDTLKLLSKDGAIIETITYPAVSENKSYSRCALSDLWNIVEQTRNNMNATCASPTASSIPTASPTDIYVNTKDVYISEFVANPDKDSKEWVELYNSSDTDYYVKDWYIDDVDDGGAAPYQFSLQIPAHGYNVVELNRDLLNNTVDEVRLLTNNRMVVDKISYSQTQSSFSWGISGTSRDSFCFQRPSRTSQNNECISETAQITPYLTSAPTGAATTYPDKSDLNEDDKQATYNDYTDKVATPESIITPEVLGSMDKKADHENNNPSKKPMIYGLIIIIMVTGIILLVRVRSDMQSTEQYS